MRNSLRSLALAATILLTAAPALHADVMGTNPRPTTSHVQPTTTQKILHFFGF